MIALMVFPMIAAVIVWFAGRKDQALDPLLTTVVLLLLAVFPLLVQAMPKIAVLPAGKIGSGYWVMIFPAVWTVGFLISMAKLMWISRAITRWRHDSESIGEVDGIELRRLPGIRGPMAAGVFRKMIFVPDAWREWDEESRQWALAHEVSHHRRKDPLRRWIAGFAVAVNWFNPLVRWMVRRLSIQCEFACDEAVLGQGVPRESYARLLCDLAEDRPMRGPVLAMAGPSGLESRVRRMMRRPGEAPSMGTSSLILFAVAMAGLLAILGAERIAGYTQREIELRRSADPFPGK